MLGFPIRECLTSGKRGRGQGRIGGFGGTGEKRDRVNEDITSGESGINKLYILLFETSCVLLFVILV